MGIYLVSAMLIVAPLFRSTAALPVFLQLSPSHRYKDSPRPARFQGICLNMAASEARLTNRVEPEYSQAAEAEAVEGDVIFRIIVGTDGRVKEIHLRRGKPRLIEAAARAVSEWRYQPYLLDGNAVEVETFARVRFRPPAKP